MKTRPIDANQLYRIEKLLDTDIVKKDKVASELLEQVLYDIQHMPTITPPNEWISVEERLPEGHMQVLMWSEKWGIAEAGSYYNSRFWVYNELGDGYVVDRITHWIPLPEPPDRLPPERKE